MPEAETRYHEEPFDSNERELGENPGENVGEVVVPFQMRDEDPSKLLGDPAQISKYPQLQNVIDLFHRSGQEVWGQWNAHKGGIVLTVLSAAAVAAGTAGIGILIKRREHKEEHKNNEAI